MMYTRFAVLVSLLLLALSAAAESVTLAWSPSPDSTVTGYFVYYGTASGSYTTKVNVLSGSQATINGLTPGVTYYFAATAYNAAGLESDPSNEIYYRPPIPPQDSVIVVSNWTGVVLSFTNPTDTRFFTNASIWRTNYPKRTP